MCPSFSHFSYLDVIYRHLLKQWGYPSEELHSILPCSRESYIYIHPVNMCAVSIYIICRIRKLSYLSFGLKRWQIPQTVKLLTVVDVVLKNSHLVFSLSQTERFCIKSENLVLRGSLDIEMNSQSMEGIDKEC